MELSEEFNDANELLKKDLKKQIEQDIAEIFANLDELIDRKNFNEASMALIKAKYLQNIIKSMPHVA